jgi:hypothetical protein
MDSTDHTVLNASIEWLASGREPFDTGVEDRVIRAAAARRMGRHS